MKVKAREQRDAVTLANQRLEGELERLGIEYVTALHGVTELRAETERLECEVKRLLDAIQQALKSGRGTSGRIILDASDEAALRAALSTANGEVTE
jgi:hypothetical protein